jgi:glycosyltransferase involved in cell wall biosynthesis
MHTTSSQRKKVLLLVTKSNFGGAQRYVFDLATHLPKDQFDITVAAGGDGMLFNKCKESGIKTITIPYLERDISLFKEFKAFWNILKLIRKEKPDIVHLNSPKMGGLAGLASRIACITKIVYTNHGWTFHEDRSWLQKVIIKIFSWKIILLSTQTIVLSEKEKKDILSWPFVKNKIQIIPLGIEDPIFFEKSEARKKLFEFAGQQDNSKQLILSIGELTKNKGYEHALKALENYPEPYTYMIAGTGETQDVLEKEIRNKNLNVYLLGYIPHTSHYLKAVDVFLLPSIKEGLPYVLLEAGFAEVPVIATNVGGIPDLAGTDKNILIPAKYPEAIRNALKNKNYFYPPKLPLQKMIEKTVAIYNQ